jgi:WhiB family transcriptional regulator, redox-sensing transcriptional regulator
LHGHRPTVTLPILAAGFRATDTGHACERAHKTGWETGRKTGTPAKWSVRPKKGDQVALTWIRTHDWDTDAWRLRAACRDTSPELFFPIGTTGVALDQIEAAKRVCGQCPVTAECLEFALATNQEAGVWGGLTEEERRRVRKNWTATASEVRVG